MSPARKDLNYKIIPNFAQQFNSGNILFVGKDTKWDYSFLFPTCNYQTLDKEESKNPDILADIQNCPQISDNSCDGIIMTGVYEFLLEPQKAIKEIHRILRPGGKFLFCAPGYSYNKSMPYVTLDEVQLLLRFFRIERIDISYFEENKVPYYFHTFCSK